MNTTRFFALFFATGALALAVAIALFDISLTSAANGFEVLATIITFSGFAFVVGRDFGPRSVAQGVKAPAIRSLNAPRRSPASRPAHRAATLAANRRVERALIEVA